jgi:hypothetical protein
VRVLFSGTPVHGHLLPLLPLARAMREQGADTAMLTAASAAPLLEPDGFPVLGAGPDTGQLVGEVLRTTGHNLGEGVTVEAEAEFFAGARVDLGFRDSLAAAGRWSPDLIVSEMYDFVGPMVADAMHTPAASVGIGPASPDVSVKEFQQRVGLRYSALGIEQRPLRWYLDTCPAALQREGWQRPEGWHGLRPEAHRVSGHESVPAAPSAPRPRILVIFGTMIAAPGIVDALIDELLTLDVDLRVTLGPLTVSDFTPRDERVEFVPFVPLAQLLSGVDAVVTHGGSGTVLGALTAGLPMVVVPQGADQPQNAERVAAGGAGISFPLGEAPPRAVAQALAQVLGEPRYRAAAVRIGEEIAATPSARDVARMLIDAVSAS